MKRNGENFWSILALKIEAGNNKGYIAFGITILFYVLRHGFWGMDFLGLCYALFLCLPFFILFFKVSFSRLYFPILAGLIIMWAMYTHTYPIFWMLMMVCFYWKALFSFRHRKSNVEKRMQFFKLETLFLLFVSTYDPLKETWYIEPMIWIRLYLLFAVMVMAYAGYILLLHDIQVYREQYLHKKARMRRRAI